MRERIGKTQRVRIILLVFIGLIMIGVWSLLWVNLQEQKKKSDQEKGFRLGEHIDQQLEKIRFVEEKKGKIHWELEAKAVQQYQKENRLTLEEVKVIYYSDDGRIFTLSGNQGKVYQDSKNLELIGNVVLATSDGYRLQTHSLFYDHSKKKVTSPDPIEWEGKEIRLVGQGMWVNLEEKTFKVLHQVKTRWKGEKG